MNDSCQPAHNAHVCVALIDLDLSKQLNTQTRVLTINNTALTATTTTPPVSMAEERRAEDLPLLHY